MLNMGSWEGPGSTRYSTLPYPPSSPPPRVHPPSRTPGQQVRYGSAVRYGGVNEVVGLRSVAQLSLYVLFSGLRTMTEVYNLFRIDNR